MGAFSVVENAKMRGPGPEMPKTGSPLAKGEIVPIKNLLPPARPIQLFVFVLLEPRAQERP